MSVITTHILDTSRGSPAQGVSVTLEWERTPGHWQKISNKLTNQDGRVPDLWPKDKALKKGTYSLTFETKNYFLSQGIPCFYPSITIVFEILRPNEHHHVPLLLSPFGYSTYRGS